MTVLQPTRTRVRLCNFTSGVPSMPRTMSLRASRLHRALPLRLLYLEDRITPSGITRDVPDPLMLPPGTSTAHPELIRPTPGPAFDANGNVLVGNKTRIGGDLLQVYQAWKDRAGDLSAAFPDEMFSPSGDAVGVRVTAIDVD